MNKFPENSHKLRQSNGWGAILNPIRTPPRASPGKQPIILIRKVFAYYRVKFIESAAFSDPEGGEVPSSSGGVYD